MDEQKRAQMRKLSSEFVKSIIDIAERKEEPAEPNFGSDQDQTEIENLTKNLKAATAKHYPEGTKS